MNIWQIISVNKVLLSLFYLVVEIEFMSFDDIEVTSFRRPFIFSLVYALSFQSFLSFCQLIQSKTESTDLLFCFSPYKYQYFMPIFSVYTIDSALN